MALKKEIYDAENYLSAKDPLLKQLIERHGPCILKTHTDYYGELVSSIIGQQLSTKAAAAIWLRVLELFGGKMPLPDQLLEISDEQLRTSGLSRPKIRYVKDLAQHIIDKRLDLDHIATMPNEQVIEQLTAVKGIGQWSAQMFMIFALGRLDILPTGDLGIRKALMLNYHLSELPNPETCITIAANNRWHPYETVASWYLWKSLDAENPNKQTRHTV